MLFQTTQRGLDIYLCPFLCHGMHIITRRRTCAALLMQVMQCMLQNIVQEGTGFRRVECRAAALLRPQTIPQEIGVFTAIKRIDTRCGNAQPVSIQRMDGIGLCQRAAHGFFLWDNRNRRGRKRSLCRRGDIARRTAARQIKARALRFQPVTLFQPALIGLRHAVQQMPHGADQIRRAHIAIPADCAPRQQQCFGRRCKHTIHRRLFAHHAIFSGFQLDRQAEQHLAVAVGQNTAALARIRQHTVVHAEHNQMRNTGVTHAVNRATGHTVECDRNCPDVILCEHQCEQRNKRIGFHLSLSLHPGKLLHCLDQNFPQLAIFLRRLQASGILMQLCARRNAVRRAQLFQKQIQRLHILRRGFRLIQSIF